MIARARYVTLCSTLSEENILRDMQRESLKNILTKDLHEDGKLSTRATNCCLTEDLNSLHDIVCYFEEGHSFLEIRNAGQTTSRELEALCKEVLDQISSGHEKTTEDDFARDYFTRHGHKPMFWILQQRCLSGEDRDLGIFSNFYPVFENRPVQTEAELAASHNLSTQRINQIKNNVYKELFSLEHSFIKEMKDDWTFYAREIKGKDVIWQDDDRVSRIVERENVQFTPAFILQMLSAIAGDTHVMHGDLKGARRKKQWKNSVLLPKEATEAFNFERLVTDVEQLISVNLLEMLSDIKSYILRSPGWLRYQEGILGEVIDISSNILEHEFGISTVDGKVIIPPSLVSNAPAPGTKPGIKKTKPARAMGTTPLVHVTTPSNDEKNTSRADTIKPRGIRGTIAEFLHKHDTPQTIEAITQHVLRYFPGKKEEDIAITMYSDSKKRFTRHGKGLFGLTNKDYTIGSNEPSTPGVARKTFEERLADLEKFLLRNWHFPFSISGDQDESSLYRWWRLQRINRDQLPAPQKAEVERIEKLYGGLETEKKAHEWDCRYNTLIAFIIDHQKLPSPRSTGLEGLLHEWYKKTTRDYKTRRLTDEQVKKYLYIEKMIK